MKQSSLRQGVTIENFVGIGPVTRATVPAPARDLSILATRTRQQGAEAAHEQTKRVVPGKSNGDHTRSPDVRSGGFKFAADNSAGLIRRFKGLAGIFMAMVGLVPAASAVSITQTADWTFNVSSPLDQNANYNASWNFTPFDQALGTLVSVDFNAQLNARVIAVMLSPSAGLVFPNVNLGENFRFTPAQATLAVPSYFENVEFDPVSIPPRPGQQLYAFPHVFNHTTTQAYDTPAALAAFSVPQTLQIGLQGSSRRGTSRFDTAREMNGDLHVSLTYNYSPTTVPDGGATWPIFVVALGGVLAMARSFGFQRNT